MAGNENSSPVSSKKTTGTAMRDDVSIVETGSREGWLRYVFGSAWRFLLVSFTIIGGVVGAIQLLIWLNSTPKIVIRVADKQCLTAQKKTPELISTHLYKGKPVTNLWAIKIALENNSARSIIGHNHSDLISTDINFQIDAPYFIVSYDIEDNQFNAQVQVDTNRVSFSFTKWKPSQSCVLRLLCTIGSATDSSDAIIPNVSADLEQLSQGVICVEEVEQCRSGIKGFGIFAFMSEHIAICLVWFGRVSFSLVLIAVLIFLLFFTPWITGIRRMFWEMLYGRIVEAAGAKQGAAQSWDYHTNLEQVPAEFWDQMKVPKPPAAKGFLREWAHRRRRLAIAWVCGLGTVVLSVIALCALYG